MYPDLKNKVVIVSGGAGAIGGAAVRAFLENGAKVAIIDKDTLKGEEILKELKGKEVVFIPTELSDEAQVKQMVGRVMEKFGQIDILVNIAGGAIGGDITDIDLPTFYKNIDMNLTSTWLCIQKTIPHMKERGGVIVNISSVNGLIGIGEAAYSAAKAGVDSLARTTAVRYGRYGIRCNSLALGTIATFTRNWAERLKKDPKVLDKIASKIPRKKVGTPEEAASIILFLASDASRLINGATVVADGGWTLACGTVKEKEGPWWED